jgi:hypothetical protein
MKKGKKTRISWGSLSAYVLFYAYIVAVGLAATFHWRVLDSAFALVTLIIFGVGSLVIFWRAWKHRGEPGGAHLGQLSALPPSWRKWMLGEGDEDSNR